VGGKENEMEGFFHFLSCPERLWVTTIKLARQRLSKHVPAAMNTHAAIRELLDSVFSVRSVSYQGLDETDVYFFRLE
jgi:hypothetical protein